ncbi:MAG: IPT/TIG domain-containing protein, partial [Candidatus Omnitrophica bacterium]|nr:IPT/TIG domain-containing protein [Candidatus Omnitrophota bacterium]
MQLVDERGRFLGRLNLLDAGILLVLAAMAPFGYYLTKSIFAWDPEITQVIPTWFNTEEGGRVAILGKNFQRKSMVHLDEVLVQEVTYESPGRLTAVLPPPLPAGQHHLFVTNTDGSKAALWEAIEAVHPPRIDGVQLLSNERIAVDFLKEGAGGRVVIVGENFHEKCSVTLGVTTGQPDQGPYWNTRLSPTRIEFEAGPSHLPPGHYDVTVENPRGLRATMEKTFTVLPIPFVIIPLLLELDTKEFLRLGLGKDRYLENLKETDLEFLYVVRGQYPLYVIEEALSQDKKIPAVPLAHYNPISPEQIHQALGRIDGRNFNLDLGPRRTWLIVTARLKLDFDMKKGYFFRKQP